MRQKLIGVGLLVGMGLLKPARADAPSPEGRGEARPDWAPVTASPSALEPSVLTDSESDLLTRCGKGDVALDRVAKGLVSRRLENAPMPEMEALSDEIRAAGGPYVWPRAWVVAGRALDHEATVRKFEAWRDARPRGVGTRRCGVASGQDPEGTTAVAVVLVDVAADLSPLPTRTHVGTWLTVESRMRVEAHSASVLVLGPAGLPRRVPTSLDGGRIRARFAPESPGAFTVQVLADVGSGPRPVLEARVFADVEPHLPLSDAKVPGELDFHPGLRPVVALHEMVSQLRQQLRLSPLARDSGLDAVALAHARAMQKARATAHDLGHGDPVERLATHGIFPRISGENVAHAANVVVAHRSLWGSPSHRANLMRADYTHVGLAAIDDPDGSVWVVEVFAAGL